MATNAEDRKRERIEARVNREIKDTIVRAAELQGLSVSDFVVQAAFQSAQSIIETQSVIRLSEGDARRFVQAIDRPTEPGLVLKAAMDKRRKLLEVTE